jgi:NAD-dependent deacetylase
VSAVEQVARRIGAAQRLTILTGAGVSAASGVPTFRGSGGLWKQYRAEDLATPDAFRRDPALVWEWYDWRRRTIARCAPNAAHHVMARWPAILLTQNVDDLHLMAGTRELVRLHGSIWELACVQRCAAGSTPWRDERVPLPALPPACPHCGGLARPAVVWFGEPLREQDVAEAIAACDCDVFLTVGTSAVVYPAAGLVQQAQRHGAFTVEINPDPTPASALVDVALQGAAEVLLPELDRLIRAS